MGSDIVVSRESSKELELAIGRLGSDVAASREGSRELRLAIDGLGSKVAAVGLILELLVIND